MTSFRLLPASCALLLGLVLAVLPATAWPGTYAGSRIFGGGDVCAVFSESPTRTDEDFGVVHFYVRGYARDFVRAAYPEFHLAGGAENARGLVLPGGGIGMRRPVGELRISSGDVFASSSFTSLLDSTVRISYHVFATPGGVLAWDIEIHNSGTSPRDIGIVPVIRFHQTPAGTSPREENGNLFTTAVFAHAAIGAGFNDDQNISSVTRTSGAFPGLRKQITIGGRSIVHARMILYALSAAGEHPRTNEIGDLATARASWKQWYQSGVHPPIADHRIRSAYEATLSSLAATSLRGAVPADMTGQFVTEGRPQLYPRDALMTARALAEAGHVDLAGQILTFWNRGIPEKVPGEWYARYDAEARATAGGSGAPFDLPEWDANGYYASLALRIYALTGRRLDDSAILHRLLDFVVSRQDTDGLLHEGGIIEWEGRLPATTMNVAAGLRHGAILAELDGDRVSAARWRSAARRMEEGLEKLFSISRGAYMDQREGREQFNTSANFGFIWGYPDHLELAQTNAWYRGHTWRLGSGEQYFEADGYGSDLFGFTTAASAQYHLVADDPAMGLGQVRWMMDHSNVYGMMPERVLSPEGTDVSLASPLSWCNGEFAAAVLTAARVGEPSIIGDGEYAWRMLGRDLASVRRVLEGLAAARVEASTTRTLAAAITPALRACADRQSWGVRLAAVNKALAALERQVSWTDPVRSAAARRAAPRRSGWRDDVGILVAGVRQIADRLAWNQAGLSMAASGPASVVLGEEATVRVDLEGPRGTRWRSATIEWRDGNRVRSRQVVRIPPGVQATVRLPLQYRAGVTPYATAWRVTAEGEVQNQVVHASRSGSIEVSARYATEVRDVVVGDMRSGVGDDDRVIRVRALVSAPPVKTMMIPPPGWTLEPAATDSDGRGWSWHARPERDLVPGHYRFLFYGFARPGTRGGSEETALVMIAHAVSRDLSGEWQFRTGDDSRWAARVLSPAGWSPIAVPRNWEAAGHPDYDGHAWYRLAVRVPEAWRGRDLLLTLGAVDDEDWTFWNGTMLGHTAVWNQKRQYRIPAALVDAGEMNTVAVHVFDGLYGGGIWQGPVQLELAPH